MEKVTLPNEHACEPHEEARQPLVGEDMCPDESKKSKQQKITFAESAKEQVCSQSSSTYKEALSQPPASMSHRQKLLWLQKRRNVGLWVQCDDCQRWRWLADALDSHDLPARWYCKNNPDSKMADCSIPEAPLRVRDEEDLIHAEYSCGSLVWARLAGWPWWPAMVDDCPDVEQYYWLDGFSDIPTYYNVVFFDASETTRAWIAPNELKPFEGNNNAPKNMKNKKRLQAAMKLANDAYRLSSEDRLQKYSFVARYKGPINSPKKIKKHVLKQYQKKLERKYQVPFPIESTDDDSEGDSGIQEEPIKKKVVKRRNVIIIGTPKSKKPSLMEGKQLPRNVILVGTPKNMNKMDKSEALQAVATSTEENNAVSKPPRKLRDIIEDTITNLQDSAIDYKNINEKAENTKKTALNESTQSTINFVQNVPALIESTQSTINFVQNVPETESTYYGFKEPNSMAAQCGSTKTPTPIRDSTQRENLSTSTPMEDQETQRTTEQSTLDDSEYRDILAPSPSSDDFEF